MELIKPMTATTYEKKFESVCPQCSGITDGVGLFATGEKIIDTDPDTDEVIYEYQPMAGELLKNFAQVCNDCGWDAYG